MIRQQKKSINIFSRTTGNTGNQTIHRSVAFAPQMDLNIMDQYVNVDNSVKYSNVADVEMNLVVIYVAERYKDIEFSLQQTRKILKKCDIHVYVRKGKSSDKNSITFQITSDPVVSILIDVFKNTSKNILLLDRDIFCQDYTAIINLMNYNFIKPYAWKRIGPILSARALYFPGSRYSRYILDEIEKIYQESNKLDAALTTVFEKHGIQNILKETEAIGENE